MSRKHWTESDDPRRIQRGLAGTILLWTLGFLILGALVGVTTWGFGVLTSDVKGRGDATRQKNSATNRIGAQERFEDLFAEIESADKRLDQAAADLATTPGDPTLRTNYTGLRNHCLDVVGDYNAEARKYTAAQFRAIDLPLEIDDTDPATDCKENAR